MNTLFPELIIEEDEAMFSSNLFKLYKLDERCGKLEAPNFRVLYLKDKKTQIHISNHFNSPTCIISYYNIIDKSCVDARTISKKLFNKIHDHYFDIKKKIF
jgi:hypothetical protein